MRRRITMNAPSQVRRAVLDRLAGEIRHLGVAGVTRVAVDGVDGAGKTVFADEIAQRLIIAGATVIRAGVDDFHNPASIRYVRGKSSPEGYFRDSYDYASLRRLLLDPLSPEGNRRYVDACYDFTEDRAVSMPTQTAVAGSILVLDGIFLHRDELWNYWDYSVFLDVGFEISVARCAARDGTDPDAAAPSNRRYVEGQRLYLQSCCPAQRATVVVNNDDLDAPRVVE